HARVVHHSVEPPQLGDGLLDRRFGLAAVGDVGLDGDGPPALVLDAAREVVEAVLAAGDDGDCRPQLGQERSGCLADAAAGAGDEGDGFVESFGHADGLPPVSAQPPVCCSSCCCCWLRLVTADLALLMGPPMTPWELGSMLAPGPGAVVGVDPDDDPPPPHAPRVRATTTRPAATAGALLMVTVSVRGAEN